MKELFLRAIELKKTMTEKTCYQTLPKEAVVLNEELDVLLKTDCSKFHQKEQALLTTLFC